MPRLRAYRPADHDAVYDICVRTGAAGEDATPLLRDPPLLGHIYAGPYLELAPELAFVVEDDDGVAGYILGAADTAEFEDRLERDWWPELRRRYPTHRPERASQRARERARPERPWERETARRQPERPGPRPRAETARRQPERPGPRPRAENVAGDATLDDLLVALVHAPARAPADLVAAYPSHLHIDLLPRLQGQGWGRRLINTLLERLRAVGSHGLHLGVAAANTDAQAFYRAVGFTEVDDDGVTVTFAMPLQ
jgi:ribosomal protein S18 acetylase RimI-like enzyme